MEGLQPSRDLRSLTTDMHDPVILQSLTNINEWFSEVPTMEVLLIPIPPTIE